MNHLGQFYLFDSYSYLAKTYLN
uniref:Uncharacterized protein n=1 Tax=Rhizophora mucronata TaxID=61149 RepID=A0A2P2IID8_RHIMU